MTELPSITVDVVCAWPDRAWQRRVNLPSGSTVQGALAASGGVEQLGLTKSPVTVGVFGKVVPLDHRLCDGDRVELYRPLLADPKDARRKRASGVSG